MPARPPYVLDAPTFRFPALAASANRAPLGGVRETALACFVCARLVGGFLPPQSLAPQTRAERAASARAWLGTIALPAPVRAACARLIDATAGERNDVVPTLAEVMEVTAPLLDPPAHSELSRLLALLRG